MMCRFVDTYMKLWYASKPTIAAVQGWCIGGGTDMVLCADIIIAGEGAALRLPAVARLGHADDRDVGLPHGAREGEALPAHRRRDPGAARPPRIGLILEAVPDDAAPGPRDGASPQRMAQAPDEPARHAEAALQPDRREHGPRLEPHARHRSSTASPATPRKGSTSSRARRRGRLPPGGARARRPVRATTAAAKREAGGLSAPGTGLRARVGDRAMDPPIRPGRAARLPRLAARPPLPRPPPTTRPPASDGLSGRDIYQRVIDNKLDTAYIEHRIVSTDPGGSVQNLAFWSRFKDLRTPDAAPGRRGDLEDGDEVHRPVRQEGHRLPVHREEGRRGRGLPLLAQAREA